MKPDDLPPQLAGCWRAHLDLLIEARAQRSVLARNRHEGPLRVQKALYPEGEGVCQVLVLHPPAGIAGGDQLRIEVEVTAGAHAQLTTPGAGKWYKARGAEQALATQAVDLRVAPGAVLEWLPQEVIVFDRANALATTTVTLAPGARAIGWDILCLGRQASGEQFAQGCYRQRFRLQDEAGRPLWQEAMQLGGGDAAMSSAVALEGHTVFGSLWIAGTAPDAELVGKLRELRIRSGACGVSALPHVTVLRLLSNSSEHARQYFEAA
ncbi:urease accessory protein UreD [Candidatus Dactylopiibacterium carminicum]|nr:urease accessory protein UreD [Candidatus Dactylopiibacterium carminicum]